MLAQVQETFSDRRMPYLLSGLDPATRAAVYQVGPRKAIVQAVDFLARVTEDYRTYGAIAAAQAMSGVFALGGEVVLAINVLSYPRELEMEAIQEVLRGGADKVDEAGAVIAGGQLSREDHLKYGLAVTGICDPRQYFTSAAARVGDQLYLTKPLGSGVITAAARQGEAHPEWLDEAVGWMLQLNRQAAQLAARSAHAITDVTARGLLGDLWEVSRRSDAAILVETRLVPSLGGALDCLARRFSGPGTEHNGQLVSGNVRQARPIDQGTLSLLLDPQVSGGLLVCVPHNRASRLETRFQDEGLTIWRIGEVIGGEPGLELM